MFSPSVNKHFPSGTSPFSSGAKTAKVDVGVPANSLNLFNRAKSILDSSYYTKISTKRDCLRGGLAPVEQTLAEVQKQYSVLYDSYEKIHTEHNNLAAAVMNFINDVEKDYKLSVAKMELIARIAGFTDISQLPSMPNSVPPSTETCGTPAAIVSACPSPSQATSEAKDAADSEEKTADVPRADPRVKFADNYPDFHDAKCDLANTFSAALNL